ncbi:MAG: hypothetical protein WKF86_01285 [Acidimicrobiales bacterium]
MPETGQLFAVTTRSRLKGPWFFPAMVLGTRRIRRQLQSSPDVVRWASVIAAPTEFWTITVWRTRHDMNEFAQSGAHDEIMWRFSKWLESFWLMRWRPGPAETGAWDGLSLAQPMPQDMRGTAVGRPELQEALEYLPQLKASTDATGRATYEASPAVRKQRAEVAGARAVVVFVHSGGLRRRAGLRALRRLKAGLSSDDELLRAAAGFGASGDGYLLTVWSGAGGASRFLRSPELAKVLARWPDTSWTNEWLPENEFGHWDGLRLRRNRGNHGLRVPEAGRVAAELPAQDDSA